MPRRTVRLVAAAIAGVAVALAPVGLASMGLESTALADEAGPVPTPSPSALASIGPDGPTTPSPATSSAPVTAQPAPDPYVDALGRTTDDFVSPVLLQFFITVTSVVTSPAVSQSRSQSNPQSAANLEPGGGSSAKPRDWQPAAVVKIPVAVRVPAGSKQSAGLTKDEIIWAAYEAAAKSESGRCHLPVMLLAAIGEVESSSLRGRTLNAAHEAVPPVIGPALNGGAYPAIHDTDGGALDGDPVWDHAVGPMQFIPATWRIWGADGNGDGVKDPQNIEDAALAAAHYLCAGGRDLSQPADLRAAVLSYNHSLRYASTVLGIVDAVSSGAVAGP